MHGQVIQHGDLDALFPRRTDFLDATERARVDELLRMGKPVRFFASSVMDSVPMQDRNYARYRYKLVMFGVLEDGRRASIVIGDIVPFIYVRVPEGTDPAEMEQRLITELEDLTPDEFTQQTGEEVPYAEYWSSRTMNTEIVRGRPLMHFQDNLEQYIKLSFHKLSDRRRAIGWLNSRGVETAHDDMSCYYRVAFRDHKLEMGKWLLLKKYSGKATWMEKYLKGDVLGVRMKDIDVLHDDTSRDNSMVMTWDIETFNGYDDGALPQPNRPLDRLFMIGATFHWHHEDDALLQVCFVDVDSAPHPDFLTVICGNERDVLLGFAQCCGYMQPEFMFGFNDNDYDWPWYIERAKQHGIIKTVYDMMSSAAESGPRGSDATWSKHISIKLEGDRKAEGVCLAPPGIVPVDVRSAFRRIYKTAESSSLNFFLGKHNLAAKNDMPIRTMFDIYSAASARSCADTVADPFADASDDEIRSRMAEVAAYCVVDARRCHELMKVRARITDSRETANLSMTSIFDAFIYADGMRVRNAVFSEAEDRGLKGTSISHDTTGEKYPGAFVFTPIKCVQKGKLNIDERITEARAGNEAYADWLEMGDDEIEAARRDIAEGRGDAITIPCVRQMLDEPAGRPITGLDFASLYPSIIMTYNFSMEFMLVNYARAKEYSTKYPMHAIEFQYEGRQVRGWSIKHLNVFDPAAEGYRFGVVPTVLKRLLDRRNEMKKELKRLGAALEAATDPAARTELAFQRMVLDAKQNALKIFMNSFYGEMGNKLSALYMLQIAGGITAAGKDAIHKACAHAQSLDARIFYGDTDSLYMAMPERHFADMDRDYLCGAMSKHDYYCAMVNRTITEAQLVAAAINEMLLEYSRSVFLKMSYEEVLFPILFTAKKKYVGLPHEHAADFSERELFIKGMLKQRGLAGVMIRECKDVLYKCFALDCAMSMHDMVLRKIHDMYHHDWSDEVDLFGMSAEYRPTKGHAKVLRFVARMAERGITVRPGERFKFVIVEPNGPAFDIKGRIVRYSTGDCMEYIDEMQRLGLRLDVNYYITHYLVSQLARFISYLPMFGEPAAQVADEEKADKCAVKAAKKYLLGICKRERQQSMNMGPLLKFRYTATMRALRYYVPHIQMLSGDMSLGKMLDDARAEVHARGRDWASKYLAFRGKRNVRRMSAAFLGRHNLVATAERLYEERQAALVARFEKCQVDGTEAQRIVDGLLLSVYADPRIAGEEDLDRLRVADAAGLFNAVLEDLLPAHYDGLLRALHAYTVMQYEFAANYEYIWRIRETEKALRQRRTARITVMSDMRGDIKSMLADLMSMS